jgi:DNA-binding protein HU-beta
MNKAELTDKIAKSAKISKKAAGAAIHEFTRGVTEALKKGDRVTLVGFGSFDVRKRAARKGRNPRTGGTLNIPAKRVVKFRPGADLKKKVK